MFEQRTPIRLSTRPRVIVIGAERHSLGFDVPGFDLGAETAEVSAAHPARQMLRVARQSSRLIRYDGFEVIHLRDARFAPAALWLRRRHGVPVSATLTAADMQRPLGAVPGSGLRSVGRLDEAFVADPEVFETLRRRAPRLPVTMLDPVAVALPRPDDKSLADMSRILAGLPPGRVVVAAMWPAKSDRVRWYRDAIAPLLLGNPLTLLLGAPSRGEVRRLTASMRRRAQFVAHYGRVDARVLAAAARCADVFVTIGEPARPYGREDETLALASSRVPLVASGTGSATLEHERNAFVTAPGDGFALVSTLNKLLALPAVQRHELGIEFAAHTLGRWDGAANAEIYAERFAALVGRPQIPQELRAA